MTDCNYCGQVADFFEY